MWRAVATRLASFVQYLLEDEVDAQVQEYWDWIGAALFLLTTVDMTTTLYASAIVGAGAERNPVMRWLLSAGIEALVVANLAAVLLVAVFFYGLIEMLRATPDPYHRYFAAGIEAWLGGLLAAGLLIFANNLVVIFFGQSLF